MKKMQYVWLLLIVLALMVSACGGGDAETAEPTAVAAATAVNSDNGGERPAATEAAEEPQATEEAPEETATEAVEAAPTEEAPEVAPTEAPAHTAIADRLDPKTVTALSAATLDSYHVQLTMAITPTESTETATVQSAVIEISVSGADKFIEMTANGMAETGGQEAVIQVIQSGGNNYMSMTGLGCIAAPAGSDTESITGDLPSADDFLKDLESATLVSDDEEINGVSTIHYSFDKDSFADDMQIEEAEGDVYIAKEGNYVIRMDMTGKGQFDLSGDSQGDVQIHLVYDLTNINETVEITVPEECTSAGANSDLPMLEDATETASFGGMTTYKSASSLTDAVEFYRTELTAAGWTEKEGALISDSTASIDFTNEDGQTLNILMTYQDNALSVILSVSEE